MFASKDIFQTASSGPYTIARSVRLRSSASAYLTRTPSSNGSRQIFTWSAWIKRGTLGSRVALFNSGDTASPQNGLQIIFFGDNTIYVNATGGATLLLQTTAVYRDPSAWYHIVLAVDTTQATASNRVKIYVNGVQVTAFGTATYPSQNQNFDINNTSNAMKIGASVDSGATVYYYDGYLTEINFIDGQALTPSSFGSTNAITGVWQPAKYTGTYGTNGFYLNFSDNSSNTATTIGKDYSGNSNNWTPNNISVTAGVTYDSMTDVPTLTSATTANYATLNPTVPKTYCTQTDGNLKSAGTSSTDSDTSVATIGVSSGKWYWEDKIGTINSSVYPILGAGRNILSSFVGLYPGISSVGGFGIVVGNGNIIKEGSTVTTVTALVANDVVGYALDLGALTCAIYKNNSLIYTVTSLTAGTYYPMANEYSSSNSTHNYGQQGFTYTPPTGFVALNTYNLPASTIKNGAAYMAATTWTGDSVSPKSFSNAVNGVSFQPDFVWIKNRSNAYFHNLYDSVRGTGSTKNLISNGTYTEGDSSYAALYGYLSAFNSNGFQTTNGTDATGPSIWVNQSGQTFVGWQWKAGTTSSSNTNGTITSTVSVGATQGFSVVTYTGNSTNNATVGHGLGVVPSMIILKNRSGAYDWPCYHTSIGSGGYIYLNQTAAKATDANMWKTTPTSTVFTLGTYTENNGSSNNYVAYCFSAVAGYSAFGSYTGNGSTDGPFCYTGFRPRWIMVKRTDTTGAWEIYDSSRGTYNVQGPKDLMADSSGAENASTISLGFDFLSNGIKCRDTTSYLNTSGGTYIYMAFAEVPFKSALGR